MTWGCQSNPRWGNTDACLKYIQGGNSSTLLVDKANYLRRTHFEDANRDVLGDVNFTDWSEKRLPGFLIVSGETSMKLDGQEHSKESSVSVLNTSVLSFTK